AHLHTRPELVRVVAERRVGHRTRCDDRAGGALLDDPLFVDEMGTEELSFPVSLLLRREVKLGAHLRADPPDRLVVPVRERPHEILFSVHRWNGRPTTELPLVPSGTVRVR